MGVGIWTYIQLAAGGGPVPVVTAWSHRCYTGTVHTIAASTCYNPLVLESLLDSLLGSLLGSLLERAALRVE